MSDDLIVIVPTRGRPDNAVDLIRAFSETDTQAMVVFAIDEDDPKLGDYRRILARRPNVEWVEGAAPSTMVKALNDAATHLADGDNPPFALGFMGDDHRPRTMNWDQVYVRELRKLGTGIVYGDDLLQGSHLPTQVAVTSDIVRALGYMAPPSLTHLYVDNFWRALGREMGRLRFLPDVVVEHVHPGANKAEWDAGYERVNAPSMWDHDKKASRRYMSGQFHADLVKLRPLLGRAR